MKKQGKFLENLLRPFSARKDRGTIEEEDLEVIAAKDQKVFKYEALVAATKNFSPKNKLGEGGFGPVFKGSLGDGREVAVKRLGRGSRQGGREFANEAMLLSKVQHRNVVNLHGYCSHDDERLLVYEYVPNESLDKLIFASSAGGEEGWRRRSELSWQRRYDVMLGVAKGLQYLHEDAHTTIVHRDIKASNILLDERWVPKIADFGMARLFPEDLTHVKTRVAGTNGYMAPEYLMHGSLSTKVDVFSFGVLMLELISGRKNSAFVPVPDAQNLLEWAWRLHKKGQILDLLDSSLKDDADSEQVAMCVQVGLLCTQSDPKLRPDMRRVVVILSKKPSNLEEPSRPGIPGSRYWRRAKGESSSSSNKQLNIASTSASASASASMYAFSSNANNTVTSTTTTHITTTSPRSPLSKTE